MEFRQLRYFVAAAEHGNMLAAARRLHVSQPPLTRQIHALEEHLGVKLLERHSRGVALTPAGVAFLEDARRMLELERTSPERSRAASRGEVGQLDVAYVGTAIYDSLPRVLRRFTDTTPGATLSLTPMAKPRQVEALRAGSIHVGFGRFFAEEVGITVEHLEIERLCVAIPKTRAAEFPLEPSLSTLRREPLILFPREGRPSFADHVISLLRRGGAEPKVVAVVDDVNAALGLVSAGLGVSIVPASVARLRWPLVAMTRLRDKHASVPVSFAYLTQAKAPILRAFLRAVHTMQEPAPPRRRSR